MLSVKPYFAALALWASVAAAQQDEAKEERLILPSGLEAHLHETIWNERSTGLAYRFRFVAPDLTGQEDFETKMTDLEYLCNSYAVPRLANIGPQPSQIVISIANRESEFGVIDPDVIQIFEAYRLNQGGCIWEMF
ncbi:DUF6497 family protein [uncultured Roseovarius sp.]|uniref:DUF6497 family protein n=1 Tax=uncultured Roseovarius sp. TaxID=293344 RepID=UPI0025F97610|nr:DUF6497 family protein [uncultured Roseovarius sp.]